MTVGDYHYYYQYKKNLEIFKEQNIYLMTITQKVKISKEIEWLTKLLTVKNGI